MLFNSMCQRRGPAANVARGGVSCSYRTCSSIACTHSRALLLTTPKAKASISLNYVVLCGCIAQLPCSAHGQQSQVSQALLLLYVLVMQARNQASIGQQSRRTRTVMQQRSPANQSSTLSQLKSVSVGCHVLRSPSATVAMQHQQSSIKCSTHSCQHERRYSHWKPLQQACLFSKQPTLDLFLMHSLLLPLLPNADVLPG